MFGKKNRALVSVLLILCLLVMQGAALATNEVVSKAAVRSVKLDYKTKTLLPGRYFQLTATISPESANQSVTWKSSNTKVAKVGSDGRVKAIGIGSTTISCTTKSGGKVATCTIKVSNSFSKVNYHFYGIGNSNYRKGMELDGPANDLPLMDEMFYFSKYAGASAITHIQADLTTAQMHTFLQKMVDDPAIGADDVTVFYYSGHALSSTVQTERGALIGVDFDPIKGTGFLTVNEVQKYLDKVKGNVVVLLDCCLSGQYIYSKGTGARSAGLSDLASVNGAWIQALSSSKASNFTGKALTDSAVRTKYKIITGCNSEENTVEIQWSLADGSKEWGGLFTGYMALGATPLRKSNGYSMKADTNNNGIVTLNELYKYSKTHVSRFVTDYNREYPDDPIAQVVQVWPENDSFPITAYKP